jgi:hypothetical protein
METGNLSKRKAKFLLGSRSKDTLIDKKVEIKENLSI